MSDPWKTKTTPAAPEDWNAEYFKQAAEVFGKFEDGSYPPEQVVGRFAREFLPAFRTFMSAEYARRTDLSDVGYAMIQVFAFSIYFSGGLAAEAGLAHCEICAARDFFEKLHGTVSDYLRDRGSDA